MTDPKEQKVPIARETEPVSPGDGVRLLRRYSLAFGFGIVALGILALLIAIYLQIAYEIIWASALAVLFFPLHRRILALVRGRRNAAAGISTFLSIMILFIPAFLTVFNLVSEVRNLLPTMREGFGTDSFHAIATQLEASPFRGVVHLVLGQGQDAGVVEIETEIAKGAASLQEALLGLLKSATKSAPSALFQVVVTLLAFFFFLRQGPVWIETIKKALPLASEHSDRLFDISAQAVNAVFRGVILTAAAQAVLAGLGFWIAGAKVPILLGCLTFLGSMIPFVGAIAVWLPTALTLFITGHTVAAIGLGLYGMLVVSLADNVIKPIVIGREMKLPTLWLFLAIIGALKLFGFLGVVVGPAILSLAFACYRIYAEERKTVVEGSARSGS
jgi:predicted PurR-regulated permease PerM